MTGFAKQISSEDRFQHIDIFKGIIILFVVVGHIVQSSLYEGGRTHPLYVWIYLFHMPAFFFCSGFLIKWIDLPDRKQILQFLKKKCHRILIPYLFWCCIMFAYSKRVFSINNFVDYVILHPGYGLWFLNSLFKYNIIALLCIVLIHRIVSKWGGVNKIVLLLAIYLIIATLAYFNIAPYIFDWNLSWFILGIIFRQSYQIYDMFTKRISSTICGIIFLSALFVNILPSILIAFTGIILLLNISLTIGYKNTIINEIVRFGKNTMPIFLLHFFLLGQYKLNFQTENYIMLFMILMVISVLISYICIFVSKSMSFGYLPILLWGEKIREHNK